MTVHHWGRFQLGERYEDFDNMMSIREKIRGMSALLIDEISMLDGQLFDVLECMIAIARCYDDVKVRLGRIKSRDEPIMSDTMLNLRWDTTSDLGLGDIEPFGGMQLLVVGDFFQLPPVPSGYDLLANKGNLEEVSYSGKIGRMGCYAFESLAWRNSSFYTIELNEVHRQSNNSLCDFLNGIREGDTNCIQRNQGVLRALETPLSPREDGLIATELYSTNKPVNEKNKKELSRLPDKVHKFSSLDEVKFDEKYKEILVGLHGPQRIKHQLEVFREHANEHFFDGLCRVGNSIELKEDAQVMLLWNLDYMAHLANGSRGVLKGFFPALGYYHLLDEEVRSRHDETHSSSCSDDNDAEGSKELVGKANSEGKSDNTVVPPNTNSSQKKQAHRVKFDFSDIDPNILKEIKSHVSNMGEDVLDKELMHIGKAITSGLVELPYVHFANGKRRIIRPQPFAKEFKGVGTATRWQLPLTLAWAISIHKSQGMTIEYLHVDLANCFAIGQAYVACSRGKCLESMNVKNFKLSEIKTSDTVKKFYQAVNSGKPYTGPTWHDTIAAFDEKAKIDFEKQKVMKASYSNTKRCDNCGTVCVVNQIRTDKNGNQGKYFLSCPNSQGERGHTWELVNMLPLNTSDTSANEVASNGSQQFRLLTPGVDGAIDDRLEGLRFVCTGLFPELGGGEGTLKEGRVNLKSMLEAFGGAVTTAISGKTSHVIKGVEPGVKCLQKAESKGIPIIDRFTLNRILIGEEEVPGVVKDESQPTLKGFMCPKSPKYEV